MTDRYNYLTVALEADTRSDDAERVIEAIRMLRGVLSVEPNVVNGSDFTAEERARREMGGKLWAVLYPKPST